MTTVTIERTAMVLSTIKNRIVSFFCDFSFQKHKRVDQRNLLFPFNSGITFLYMLWLFAVKYILSTAHLVAVNVPARNIQNAANITINISIDTLLPHLSEDSGPSAALYPRAIVSAAMVRALVINSRLMLGALPSFACSGRNGTWRKPQRRAGYRRALSCRAQ